ncbi:MAG TPA: ABC transporter permease subunit [Thermomicrobiales bacterium]|jgi:ABC-type dipeptide/oligopeptide/nickel transport system permease subunit|nr:ABC transporter permease subunit [Thermomicrobiales bacterium]
MNATLEHNAVIAGTRLERNEPARGLWSDAWKRLRRNWFAMGGLVMLLATILAAILAPWIAPADPNFQDYMHMMEGPSRAHPMGTDNFGRDILSRIIYGARISLRLGLLGTLVGASAGTLIGMISGYFGGWIDTVLMRLLDVQLAFPGLLLAIVIITILGVGEINVIMAIGVFSVPTFARMVRGSLLSLREQDFVLAARSIGVPDGRLMFAHLLPNALAPILVLSTIRLGTAILTAASLGFLGLGVRPPAPEWGTMLSEGRAYMQLAPHIAIFPGLAILVSVVAINLFGDGLRDALDPKTRK